MFNKKTAFREMLKDCATHVYRKYFTCTEIMRLLNLGERKLHNATN